MTETAPRDPQQRARLKGRHLLLAFALAAGAEGLRLHSYGDIGGIWTIGRGHTGPDVHANQMITTAQADKLTVDDLIRADDQLKVCTQEPLNGNERSAYTDMLFNLGPGVKGRGGVCINKDGSPTSVMRDLAAHRHREACEDIMRFDRAAGRDCSIRSNGCYGIHLRRVRERALCLTPVEEKP